LAPSPPPSLLPQPVANERRQSLVALT
jgi:hypothetical protein